MTRGYRVFHDFQVDWLPGGKIFNLSYPRNTAKSEKEALRMDALVRAARLPDYDPKHPERFIVEVVT
jgi:hypothetical protein